MRPPSPLVREDSGHDIVPHYVVASSSVGHSSLLEVMDERFLSIDFVCLRTEQKHPLIYPFPYSFFLFESSIVNSCARAMCYPDSLSTLSVIMPISRPCTCDFKELRSVQPCALCCTSPSNGSTRFMSLSQSPAFLLRLRFVWFAPRR